MKKSAIYLGMAALTLLSTAGGTMVHAADVGTPTKTNGTVTLQAPTQGAITLDTTKLPSTLNFGSTEIKYTADVDQIATDNVGQTPTPTTTTVEVTDNRGDNTKGWKLELGQANQFISAKGKKELDGAQFNITTSDVTNVGGVTPTDGQIKQTFSLTPGEKNAVTLLAAKKGEGDGISTMKITKYDLNVPGTSHKESDTYKSSLTWTLSDTI